MQPSVKAVATWSHFVSIVSNTQRGEVLVRRDAVKAHVQQQLKNAISDKPTVQM